MPKKRPVPQAIQIAYEHYLEAKIMRIRKEIDAAAFARAKQRYLRVLYAHGRNDLAEDVHADKRR